jgi:hypothetical protein
MVVKKLFPVGTPHRLRDSFTALTAKRRDCGLFLDM